jgi:hypothetical protein
VLQYHFFICHPLELSSTKSLCCEESAEFFPSSYVSVEANTLSIRGKNILAFIISEIRRLSFKLVISAFIYPCVIRNSQNGGFVVTAYV